MEITQQVLYICTKENKPISNIQLQKILYVLQYGYLKVFKKRLFRDRFLVWKTGLIEPTSYSKYVAGGGNPIYEYEDNSYLINEKDLLQIREAVRELRDYNPYQLSLSTKTMKKTWKRLYNHGLGLGQLIPNRKLIDKRINLSLKDLILEYRD